jgi:hypothetical protein
MASSIFIDQSGFTFSGSGTTFPTPGLFPDGTAAAPSISFTSAPSTGLFVTATNNLVASSGGANQFLVGNSVFRLRSSESLEFSSGDPAVSAGDTFLTRGGAAGKVTLAGTTPMLQLGGTTASFPALKQSGTMLQVRLADDTVAAGLGFGALLASGAAPTISSGFAASGTTLTPNNGTAAFVITVGATTPGSSGVIGLPTATNGWNCYVTDITGAAAHVGLHTVQTGSTTTSATVESQNAAGVATAWAGNSILRVSCFAF